MIQAFINDTNGLERKYKKVGEEIPRFHVTRLYNMYLNMCESDKEEVRDYLEKLKDLTGYKFWTEEQLLLELDKLLMLCSYGKKITMHITCDEMTDRITSVLRESKMMRLDENKSTKVSFVLTKVMRSLMPSLIAQQITVGDVIDETDEFIF